MNSWSTDSTLSARARIRFAPRHKHHQHTYNALFENCPPLKVGWWVNFGYRADHAFA